MKNIFYKLSFICLLTVAFVSCEEDRIIYDGPTEAGRWLFQENQADIVGTNESTIVNDTIYVGVTTTSDVDRNIPLIVEQVSTAGDDLYTIVQSSLFVPAGEYVGEVIVTINFDNLPEGANQTLVLSLDEEQVPLLDITQNFMVINIYVSCATESLSGTHTYSTYNMGQGTGSGTNPVPNTAQGSVTWANTATPGIYTTTDLSFGQFGSVWNDNPANSASARIVWSCDDGLTTSGVDQYGDTFTYDVISIEGSVMTINFSNTYGDAGTVELTRSGGADWPMELMGN